MKKKTAKETLGYRGGNPMFQRQEQQQKEKKNKEGQKKKETYR